MENSNINLDPDMAQGIEITLTDGRRYSLRDKHSLCDIDEGQEAIFLFDNGEIYHGQSDGQVDDEGDFPPVQNRLSTRDSPPIRSARRLGVSATPERPRRGRPRTAQGTRSASLRGIEPRPPRRPIQTGRRRKPDRHRTQIRGTDRNRIRERKPSDRGRAQINRTKNQKQNRKNYGKFRN